MICRWPRITKNIAHFIGSFEDVRRACLGFCGAQHTGAAGERDASLSYCAAFKGGRVLVKLVSEAFLLVGMRF